MTRPLRSRRWTAALLLAGAASMGAAAPAHAVGTGGIELTPLPAEGSGAEPVTSFKATPPDQGTTTMRFMLRNVVKVPASAEIYAAAASRSPEGRFAVGGPGSAPWIGLNRQTVELAPRERRIVDFTVTRAGAPDLPMAYGAVLVQVQRGVVVERAATIVSLGRQGSGRTVPLLLGAAAGLLLLGAGALVGFRALRAGRQGAFSSLPSSLR